MSNDKVDISAKAGERLFMLLWRWTEGTGQGRLSEVDIKEIRVRAPRFDGDTVMVIMKGTVDGVMVVGFHTADDAGTALKGALERAMNGQLKWREDRPWQPEG